MHNNSTAADSRPPGTRKESEMYISRKWILLAVILLFICLTPLRRAHAYVDPGTGNYLLQLIAAGLFGALFAFKVFWVKIRSAFSSIQSLVFKSRQHPAE